LLNNPISFTLPIDSTYAYYNQIILNNENVYSELLDDRYMEIFIKLRREL